MRRMAMAVLMGTLPFFCVSAARAEDPPTPAARQLQALLDEYEQRGNPRAFAGRFLELAEQHPRDPAAVDALLWVVQHLGSRPETTRGLELLAAHHVGSDKLAAACPTIARARSTAAEKLLRAALADSPHPQVRAQACYYLGVLLDVQANVIEQLKAQPELAPRVLQYYGRDYGQYLAALDAVKLEQQREQVYERLLESFADVPTQDSTMGKVAARQLFNIRHLSVGKRAPQIEGEDIFGEVFKLSDYRGKVVMLSFWGHWWGPCREMYPHERSLVQRLAGKPFVLLGVNSDPDREALKNTLVEERINWRSWWDAGSTQGPIQTTWQVELRPTIHLLDGQGVIRYKNVDAKNLDQAIDQLLDELAAEP